MIAQHEPVSTAILQFDEEAARRLEAMYTHPDVVQRRQRVRQALALRPGQRVLDIGCGPGFLTGEAAAEVGPNGWACGVDISAAGLAAARLRATGQPYAAWIEFVDGDATALPFPDGAFDAAVATQVYEYVNDVPSALAELRRVLRPGGRAVIVDTDWDTLIWQAGKADRAATILSAWDEHLANPALPRTLRPSLQRAGLALERVEALNILNLDWSGYSEGLAGLIAAFVPGRRGISQEEATAWLDDLRRQHEAGAYFFSLDQFLFLASAPEA